MKRVVSVLTVLALSTVGYLATSPGAHEHQDADSHYPDHECAVTLADLGFCDTSAAASLFPEKVVVDLVCLEVVPHWTTPHYWIRPAQAPPVFSA